MAQLSGSIPHARAWNITLRTSHIAVAAVLLGGHVFAMPVARLRPWLYLTVVTGSALLILEAWPGWRWCCQGRGVMVIGKLVLTSLLAWLWEYRVSLLLAVVTLGSVASHMPRRFRYAPLFDIFRHRLTALQGFVRDSRRPSL